MPPQPLPPTPTLETERLILRPLRQDDAPAIQRRFAHWEIVRHLNADVPWPYPEDGAETHVRNCLERRARGEQFFWVLTVKGGDEAIGRIDLWAFDGERRDMRGFWLALEHQGRGLMTEAAERVTAYAFEDLGWPFLYLTNAASNHRSHRVKEKQGATLIGRECGEYVQGEDVREVWRLDRETWLARRAG